MSDKKLQNRDKSGRFVRGQSGNPSGRPTTPEEVKTILKGATIPAAQLLTDTMRDETARIELRIKCAEILLDRVMGKAVQPLEAVFTTPTIDLSGFTIDELRRLAAYDEKSDSSTSGEE